MTGKVFNTHRHTKSVKQTLQIKLQLNKQVKTKCVSINIHQIKICKKYYSTCFSIARSFMCCRWWLVIVLCFSFITRKYPAGLLAMTSQHNTTEVVLWIQKEESNYWYLNKVQMKSKRKLEDMRQQQRRGRTPPKKHNTV